MLTKIIDIPNLYEEENLIDLIELKNGDIITFTEFKILKIKLGDNTDEISQIYEIPKSFLLNKGKKCLYFKKGLNIYELGNNNILIHSQMIYPIDNYRNKMIIFNLDNCQIVKYKIFQKPAFAIILKKYFCICHPKMINICDIINYEMIKTININNSFYTKYSENMIIIIRNLNYYKTNMYKDIVFITVILTSNKLNLIKQKIIPKLIKYNIIII